MGSGEEGETGNGLELVLRELALVTGASSPLHLAFPILSGLKQDVLHFVSEFIKTQG